MSLAQEDIEFIKQHLGEWLTEVSLGKPPAVYEIELRERMVRVEEALKHQGELIQQLIQQMDKRFEQVDKRFEQMDQRFVELQRRMDRFMFWSLGMTLTLVESSSLSSSSRALLLRMIPSTSPKRERKNQTFLSFSLMIRSTQSTL